MTNSHRKSGSDRELDQRTDRCGSIIALSAGMMVIALVFLVFTVDLGYLVLTKTQLHAAADAAVLGAGIELTAGLGRGATLSQSETEQIARQAAVGVAALQRAGDCDTVYVDRLRDVRFGKRDWNPLTNTWQDTWGIGPSNMVEVTVRRDQEATCGGGDSTVPLFFGPVIGHESAPLKVSSAAALLPGSGFRVSPGSGETAPVLPIALDLPSWVALGNGFGDDDYAYDSPTDQVTAGSDGILEVSVYPEGNSTPGNRGTVDLGNPNNATSDLRRQILEGLNDGDLSYFNGEIRFDQGPIDVNGDPGVSAAIKTQLEAIIGEPRAIPLFTTVTGQGNNTTYTLTEFVGIRIMAVKLTGGNQFVIVQPATVVDSTVIPGGATIAESSIFTPLKLVR